MSRGRAGPPEGNYLISAAHGNGAVVTSSIGLP